MQLVYYSECSVTHVLIVRKQKVQLRCYIEFTNDHSCLCTCMLASYYKQVDMVVS